MKSVPAIPGSEVASLLRSVIAREIPIRLAESKWTWSRTYAGDVEFLIDGWRIVFFNDCDELDYCSSAIAPDGRHADFDDWYEAGDEPISLLSSTELGALERIFDITT